MKVWRMPIFGIENLEQVQSPIPEPGPGQVLVKIGAVSLNYRDLMVVKGSYNPRLKLPRIPCSDGAGEIVALGSGVEGAALGSRVAGIFMQNWVEGPPAPAKIKGALGGDIDGTLAEYAVLSQDGFVAIPEYLSTEQAATLPCAAVTAWNALTRARRIKAGDTVVIQGTGGVSLFALQFAKALGARVLGTSGSDAKLARAKALGLDEGLNYKSTPEWSQWVLDRTGGLGADLVIDVGGVDTFQQSIKAVRMGGTVAQIGGLSGSVTSAAQPLNLTSILHRHVRIKGVYVGSRADFLAMNRALSQNRIQPVIDQVFPFDDVQRAFETMGQSGHFGKLVVRVS